MNALLALEDGLIFRGKGFGAAGTHFGELCFNTSMTGYQEILTDPSYYGQIVTMTYPHIGNYGVNATDMESAQPHVRGFVVEELCGQPSNWQAEGSLEDWLKKWNVLGIQGVDTRQLTKHLRERGAMRAVITTEALEDEKAVALAAESPSIIGQNYASKVTCAKPYQWDQDSTLSQEWTLSGTKKAPLPSVKFHLVAYDFGIKHNILRRLRQEGFSVEVVPAETTAEEVLAKNPDGIFLSNGPGDPAALDFAHAEIRNLLPHKPLFAICLGHQVLAHALGAKTFKLPFGHRGGNHPVKDLQTEKIAITSQNHGFAVDPETLPDSVEVTHINLNDNTVEGLRHRDYPAFSVQYHPEAAPGPHDSAELFATFIELIKKHR